MFYLLLLLLLLSLSSLSLFRFHLLLLVRVEIQFIFLYRGWKERCMRGVGGRKDEKGKAINIKKTERNQYIYIT